MIKWADIKKGGHRGMGCTDHDFYQGLRDIKSLPVENTVASVEAAFKAGADYVEIDAVMSKDGVIFTLHNILPEDHFFDPLKRPKQVLNKTDFADIAQCKTGRCGNGNVAKLSDMLETIAQHDPKTCDWAVNIEIKGVQGSHQNFETNDFIKILADTVASSTIPHDRILFSSFCLENIVTMSHLLPHARYAIIFAEQGERNALYADHLNDIRYRYLSCNVANIRDVLMLWGYGAHPDAVLGYVHPEIMTLDEERIDICHTYGFAINSWSYRGAPTDQRFKHYRRMATYAASLGVSFTACTDYLVNSAE